MMKWYAVFVEDKFGVQAIHFVEVYWPTDAREHEEQLGYRVLDISPWHEER